MKNLISSLNDKDNLTEQTTENESGYRISLIIGSFLGASETQPKVGAVCYRLQTVATCQRAQHITAEANHRKVLGESPLLLRVEGCPQKIYYKRFSIEEKSSMK